MPGFISEASAAVPMPAAARPKNWRRVSSSRYSRCRSMGSALGYGLIEIEHDAGGHRPGGQLGGIELLVAFGFADGQQFLGGLEVFPIYVKLRVKNSAEDGG